MSHRSNKAGTYTRVPGEFQTADMGVIGIADDSLHRQRDAIAGFSDGGSGRKYRSSPKRESPEPFLDQGNTRDQKDCGTPGLVRRMSKLKVERNGSTK